VVIVDSNQSVHLQAWRALLRAQAGLACNLERELMAAEGLPLAWYEVLLALDQAPEGALRLQRLLGTVLMTKSGVTRLVDRMETAGLVARTGCPSDRRGAFAVITDLGRKKLHRATPIHVAGIDRHLASVLDAEQAARLRDALSAIADALGSECVFLGCTGGDGEDRTEVDPDGCGDLDTPVHGDHPETGGQGRRGDDSPTMAPRGRSDHE
jgi:DNA-binding MarR family transcriptional regulator